MIRNRLPAIKSPIVAVGSAVLLLAACGAETPGTSQSEDKRDSAEAGYLAPPTLEAVKRDGARILLSGAAAPDADVRLGSPTGEVVMGRSDAVGHWSLAASDEPGVRLFGLSSTHAGRTVQAEGYVMVAQGGQVAMLRAGTGARRLTGPSSSPRILAVDIDREGGAVVSGVAAPGAGLNVRIDRTTRGGGRADDDGHFYISLTDALSPGVHDIQVAGEGGETAQSVAISRAAPLTSGPVRFERAPLGWRIDWMTPGGGVQSTFLIGGDTQ